MGRKEERRVAAEKKRQAKVWQARRRKVVRLLLGCVAVLAALTGLARALQYWPEIEFQAELQPLREVPNLPELPVGVHHFDQQPLEPVTHEALTRRFSAIMQNHPAPLVSTDMLRALNTQELGYEIKRFEGVSHAMAQFTVHEYEGRMLPVVVVDSYRLGYANSNDRRDLVMAIYHEGVHWRQYLGADPAEQKWFIEGAEIPCDFLWRIEIEAFIEGCEFAIDHGLVEPLEMRVNICQAVGGDQGRARQSLFERKLDNQAHAHCRVDYAHLAGHPRWWAYYWPW